MWPNLTHAQCLMEMKWRHLLWEVWKLTGEKSGPILWTPCGLGIQGPLYYSAPADSAQSTFASQQASHDDSQTASHEFSYTPLPASSIQMDSSEVHGGDHHNAEVLPSSSSAGYRWGHAGTLLLLDLYHEHQEEFQDTKTKKICVRDKVASRSQHFNAEIGGNCSALCTEEEEL